MIRNSLINLLELFGIKSINNISDDDQNGGDVQDLWPDQLHNYRCSKNISKSYHEIFDDEVGGQYHD